MFPNQTADDWTVVNADSPGGTGAGGGKARRASYASAFPEAPASVFADRGFDLAADVGGRCAAGAGDRGPPAGGTS